MKLVLLLSRTYSGVCEYPVFIYMPFELTIEDIAEAGGVGRREGLVYFVPRAVPGDRVLVEEAGRKRSFATARVVEVIEPSPHRVEHPCPFGEKCGGCDWGELNPSIAREYKAKMICDALRRIAGIEIAVEPVTPSPDDLGYRYRLDMRPSPFGNSLGFVGDDGFVAVDDCLLLHRDAAHIIPVAVGNLPAFDRSPERALLRWGGERGMIIYEFAELPGIDVDALLGDEVPVVVRVGERLWQIRGEAGLDLSLGSRRLDVHGPAFYQVNWELYQRVLNDIVQWAGHGEAFWDLYGGIGVVSFLLADNFLSGVLVESDSFALESARLNLKNTSGLEVVGSDVLHFVKGRGGGVPDVVFLDPPRAGMGKKAARRLAELRPRRIIYQSCNPATFARDCKIFAENGYQLSRVNAYDFFPRTHHVEMLGELELSK